MKIQRFILPLLDTTPEALLADYVRKGLLTRPALFGLENFSQDSLIRHGFTQSGDAAFSLYEKTWRFTHSRMFVVLKIYLEQGQPVSNGLTFGGGRLVRILEKLPPCLPGPDSLQRVELLADDSLAYGSLIINECLDLRFGQRGRDKAQKTFHLLGLSTDQGLTPAFSARAISTCGARAMKNPRSLEQLARRHKAFRQLADCLQRHFPAALPTHPAMACETPHSGRQDG